MTVDMFARGMADYLQNKLFAQTAFDTILAAIGGAAPALNYEVDLRNDDAIQLISNVFQIIRGDTSASASDAVTDKNPVGKII